MTAVTMPSSALESVSEAITKLQLLHLDLAVWARLAQVSKDAGQDAPNYSVEQWYESVQRQMGTFSAAELLSYISRLLFAIQDLVEDNNALHAAISSVNDCAIFRQKKYPQS